MITITEPNAVSREFDESIAPAVIRAWFATHGTPNDVLALSVRPRRRETTSRLCRCFLDAPQSGQFSVGFIKAVVVTTAGGKAAHRRKLHF